MLSFDEVKTMVEKQLEGALPAWTPGWTGGFMGHCPANAVSRHEFTGGNFILGWVLGSSYGSLFWATQKQIFQAACDNGFFKAAKAAGESSALFVKKDGVMPPSTCFLRPVFGAKRWLTAEEAATIPRAKQYNGKWFIEGALVGFETYDVYNVNHLVPRLRDMLLATLVVQDGTPKDAGEFGKLVAKLGIEIGIGRPSYIPSKDCIRMPPSESFRGDAEYMGTLAHEVGHWTGAKGRMEREGLMNPTGFGSDPYAVEEAVAEWFSILACSYFGMVKGGDDTVNHAAYIAHWTQKFNDTPGLMYDTFSQAEKAFRWFLKESGAVVTAKEGQESVEGVA